MNKIDAGTKLVLIPTKANDQSSIAGILKEAAEIGGSLRLEQGNSIITGRIEHIDVKEKTIRTKDSSYSFRIVQGENDLEFKKLLKN